MSTKKSIVLLFALFAVLAPARAQHYDPDHRHAIELTSGPASFVSRWMIPNKPILISDGRDISGVVIVPVNLGYTFSFCERWEFNAILNYSWVGYTINQYPDSSGAYDRSATPVISTRETRHVFSLSTDMRWKWLRRDYFSLYSALGLGISTKGSYSFAGAELPLPLPYVTPIGIKAGGKQFYGITELTISPSASFVLAGVGYRF